MFRSLAIANYRTWFIGALISNLGFWMQRTAQDWIVLTELTDYDAVALGVTMALQMAPVILLVPFSGYIADRFDRRVVLTFTNTAMGLLAVLLGTLVVTGSIALWHIYAVAAAGGVVAAIENPSKQGFVSELVKKERLSNAVSLNAASFNLARTAGPAIAAVLVLVVGAGWVFYLNALTFVAMIATIRLLDRTALIDTPRLVAWRGNIAGGARYVRSRPDLLALFLSAFLMGAFVMNFAIYASTMTTVEFGLGIGSYGAVLSFLAVGALIGALLAARRERPRHLTVAVGGMILASTLALAAVMPTYWAFAVAIGLSGIGLQTVISTSNAVVQLTTEPVMRGRVISIYMAIFMGGTLVGAPTIGAVANTLGPRAALLVGAFSALVASGVLGLFLLRRRGMGLRFWRVFTREDAAEELQLDQVAARRV